uniref:Uncharacterized protein n=1 Tax=Trichogramma kaykai TaxID=54128 RepID=A0ABD2XAX9_9HYME
MYNKSSIVRVKEEPGDTWPDAGDGNIFDSMDFGKVNNFKAFPLYKSSKNHVNEVMVLQEEVDKKIFIDFECKNVKLELEVLATTIGKTEDQSYQPIVKMENPIETNDTNAKDDVCKLAKCFQDLLKSKLFEQNSCLPHQFKTSILNICLFYSTGL